MIHDFSAVDGGVPKRTAHPGFCRGDGRRAVGLVPEVPQPVCQSFPGGEAKPPENYHFGEIYIYTVYIERERCCRLVWKSNV